MTADRPSMASLQEASYGVDRVYAHGSPHLTHDSLRTRIETDLHELVRDLTEQHGRCRVVEVGAGHGSFTTTLVDSGATVTVTEMSGPSAQVLRERFARDARVTVVHDPDADLAGAHVAKGCELVVFVSVLHHIPDYVAAVETLVSQLADGGAFYSTQDPIWYPDRTAWGLLASRVSFLLWRLGQGDVRRGVRTQFRRLRGVYDESEPGDMVEYHVVRKGVDQAALATMLSRHFAVVESRSYWSTQAGVLQWLGERTGFRSEFALRASGKG